MAAELALGEGDLATAPRYIWFRTASGGLSFVALGLRQIAFTTPEKAYGLAQPFRDAQLFPIHGTALTNAVMEANFGPDLTDEDRAFLVEVDPDPPTLRFLWMLQVVLGGGDFSAAYERSLAKVYDTGDLVSHTAHFALDYPQFEGELVTVHRLALRRLEHAPPEGARLLEGWKHEEQAVFSILERVHELRRARRAEVLEP